MRVVTRFWRDIPDTTGADAQANVVPISKRRTLDELETEFRSSENAMIESSAKAVRAAREYNGTRRRYMSNREMFAQRMMDDFGARVTFGQEPDEIEIPGLHETTQAHDDGGE